MRLAEHFSWLAEAGERKNVDGEGSAGASERLEKDFTKRGVHFS